jgi:hypothetical protein
MGGHRGAFAVAAVGVGLLVGACQPFKSAPPAPPTAPASSPLPAPQPTTSPPAGTPPAVPGPTTTRVSVDSSGEQADGVTENPAVSGDGSIVAFASVATNLVAGDISGAEDVFVRDRQTGTTTRVSVATGGVEANSHSWQLAIRTDGRIVAFASVATNLVTGDTNERADVFVHDREG